MQTAQTARRLPPSSITLIRDIASLEDPLLCLNNARLNRTGAETAEKQALTADCQPFASFLDTSSHKSATTFMKGSLIYEAKALLNTIYRCEKLFQCNSAKSVQHGIVLEKF